jgi:NarL family two-component system response regulator LiaR
MALLSGEYRMLRQEPIRVLIVDDHIMLRNGLKQFIDTYDDFILAGEARNGEEAVQKCEENPPDVVLMDLSMPVMDGIEATRKIVHQNQAIKIIVLTGYHEQDQVEQALQAGATSYILKDTSPEDLAMSIHSAYAGQSTLSPEATEALIQMTRQKPALGSDLTERERQVLALLVAGLSNTQIAVKLTISISTVKYHVGGILSKLGVNSRSEAIALAWKHHLIGK